jgi:hypothetical protein
MNAQKTYIFVSRRESNIFGCLENKLININVEIYLLGRVNSVTKTSVLLLDVGKLEGIKQK